MQIISTTSLLLMMVNDAIPLAICTYGVYYIAYVHLISRPIVKLNLDGHK